MYKSDHGGLKVMGCIHNKQPQAFAPYDCIHLAFQNNMQAFRIDRRGKAMTKTPTMHLSSASFNRCDMPQFVQKLFFDLNHRRYDNCRYDHSKDIYMCKQLVYSIEYVTAKHFKSRFELSKRIQSLEPHIRKHILLPNKSHYTPIDVHSGIAFQEFVRCAMDMCDFCTLYRGREQDAFREHAFDIDRFVLTLSMTLKRLHEVGVYLADVKLENILIKDGVYMFTDVEYAFVDPPTMTDKQYTDPVYRDLNSSKRRWIKTAMYVPSDDYPLTQSMFIRNDVFALARCISRLMLSIRHNKHYRMFSGDVDSILHDDRATIHARDPDVMKIPYIADCADCIVDYSTRATTAFLDNMIKTARRELRERRTHSI